MAKTVDFSSNVTPDGYICQKCGATGIKLWRESATFRITLRCAKCLEVGPEELTGEGTIMSDLVVGMKTDQIKGFVPAVPAEDMPGAYYWYGSVPTLGVVWWAKLPNFK